MSWDRKLLKTIDKTVSHFSLKMATVPVFNPVIPFLGLIPGGLRPGMMIRVKGVMAHGANRFVINLQTGCVTRPCDDVALHMSVRPTENCIVRNSLTNQIWGAEQRFGGMPLYQGQVFDILILTEASAFKVAINNVHFCMFPYRVPFHRVQFIHIEGEVSIHSITLEGDNSASAPAPHVPVMPVQPIYPPLGPNFPPHMAPRPPHWSVGAVPVLPPHATPPPPSYSPYPPPGQGIAMAYGPTPAAASYQTPPTKKKSKAALKAAAIVGGVGLGAFAISRAFTGGDDSGEEESADVEAPEE